MIPRDRIAEIARIAEAAKRLRADPDFEGVMNALSDFHLAALVACPTGDKHRDTRDHHHVMLAALREIVGEIDSRVQALEAFETDHEDDGDDIEE